MTSFASAAASATTASAASSAATDPKSARPLASLSSNFGNFLNLLMTQLKNQNPSSPMDANSFTSELVQFSSVEQQINTNTSLTQLIQLTQASNVTQSSGIIGKQVTVQSNQIPLQNGVAGLHFTGRVAAPVTITVQDANGRVVRQATVKANAGTNDWVWDGKNTKGQAMPDGAYGVTVTGAGANGAQLPFTVVGTATAVTMADKVTNLKLGSVSVPFSAITSVAN